MGCNGATRNSRYSFRRHFYQHAGFRYVESAEPVDQSMTLMERDPEVVRELDAHYTVPAVWAGLKPFPAHCAELVRKAVASLLGNSGVAESVNTGPATKTTDLRFAHFGCSVGRTCFELADVFSEVVGFDQSTRRIQHAVRLQRGETARFVTPQDGACVRACAPGGGGGA
jgi:hypothetical protein